MTLLIIKSSTLYFMLSASCILCCFARCILYCLKRVFYVVCTVQQLLYIDKCRKIMYHACM